jgi:hypothetical protein
MPRQHLQYCDLKAHGNAPRCLCKTEPMSLCPGSSVDNWI